MTTGNIVSFTGEDAYQAYLGTHQDTGSKLTAMSQTVGLSPEQKMSIDEHFFSHIHDIAIGERVNKDVEQDNKNAVRLEREKQKENEGATREAVAGATSSFKDYQEQQENKMREINGRHFSDADLEETINEIIEDKEAFQKKHNMTDEQADLALQHAMVMQAMTPDERAEYLEKLAQTDPEIANAIADDADNNHKQRENKNEISSTENDEKILEDDMLADLDDPDLSPDELIAHAENSSFADSVMADMQDRIKDSNIVKSAKLDNQQEPIANNEVTPVTPKGFEF